MKNFHNHNQYNPDHGFSHSRDDSSSITAGNIDKAQQCIYNFFLEIIKTYSDDEILDQFNKLFIRYEPIDNSAAYYALGEIIFYDKEEDFKYTILRCCYILNNNWIVNRNINACQQLVDLFLSNFISTPTKVTKLKTLKQWLQKFVQSQEYNKLRSLSGRPTIQHSYDSWAERFSTYILASESNDTSKSIEQRVYAANLSRKLKKQFKFDLALYTAKIDARGSNPQLKNPTSLGDGVLNLIKMVLNKQGNQKFRNIAQNLYKQIRNLSFGEFKDKLVDYLGISANSLDPFNLKEIIISKPVNLLERDDNQQMQISLLNIICNRLLKHILLDEYRHPSRFLKFALNAQNFLGLIIILLKIVLLCPDSRRYLEGYVAELINFFSVYSEEECNDFIKFLDVLNVTLAIFDDDTDYSLIKMHNAESLHGHHNDCDRIYNEYLDPQPQPHRQHNIHNQNLADVNHDPNFDNYRIFSQSKNTRRLNNSKDTTFPVKN
ncbi:hypothetical protein H6F44_08065 [Pseudanabaena sp. FACHB-1277]|uniref:Uncharacterized protein n=1 Tax=Pseudanabaena cinerea FACHB-1277 TaxID=2949581 RepID=A0A926USP5_9CYAN|nr:hypothetical protein [Pseudanabaena cinerea]MBD2150076.1 hypothetical protein [Pseudanabaena cinerea FACHB-1277]